MSMGLKFQINKVSRLIQQKGIDFSFKRNKLNEFKEPIKDEYDVIKVRGFYHEVSSYVTRTASEASVMKSEPQPMIFCTFEDGMKVRNNDVLEYNGLSYVVSNVQNINHLSVCCDISLELIQDGKK